MVHKPFAWDVEKNEKLKEIRDISFEEIVTVLEGEGAVAVIRHPRAAYRHQWLYIVEIENYIYAVPFVEDAEKIFLKTIFPSRKLTKKYLS